MYEAADDDFSSTPIVDWTPDFSANTANFTSANLRGANLEAANLKDPRASTSQSFTNMMTLDDDAAVELLMASDPTPSSGGKGVSRRGSGYIQCEDIQLCTSWMNISNDPIAGNEQP
ncbi:uncharacterized protein LOC120654067 [Panicum virgatum]|uniref:uncharacterized protein LOC120654067 n=1 Tax=Panicum virgatum TaxID=38727 RepID=UPI0019D5EB91|nr:uncharacterized protein LOC120654067 [Panicum virgatum]